MGSFVMQSVIYILVILITFALSCYWCKCKETFGLRDGTSVGISANNTFSAFGKY